MKARAWGNGSNDVLETAEIRFQGHLSSWKVFMSVTLAFGGRGLEWTLGPRDMRSPQAFPKSEQRQPFAVLSHLLVVIFHCFNDISAWCNGFLHLFCLTFLCFCLRLSSNREQPLGSFVRTDSAERAYLRPCTRAHNIFPRMQLMQGEEKMSVWINADTVIFFPYKLCAI